VALAIGSQSAGGAELKALRPGHEVSDSVAGVTGKLVAKYTTANSVTYQLPNGHMRTVIFARGATSTALASAVSGGRVLSTGAAPLAITEKSPPETGTVACTINQATPTTSSCAGKTIEAGWKEKSPGSGNGVHALLEFALPNLSNNAIVLNAKLELYETAATTKTKVAMSVYRITTPWASGATWSTPWKKEGGDFAEAGSLINDENIGEASGAKTWYPTRLVQRWINGASAPGGEGAENLGLLIKDLPESEDSSNVVTFDGPAASTKYPTLTIEWAPRGIGASPHYTLLTVASSASTAEKVNPASGDLLATSTDLSIAAKGLTFHVARTYDSLAPSEPGYGTGWTDNNTEHLRVEGDGSVEYTDPSGATFEFIKNGGVLGTPPELAKEVVMCLPGKEDTEGYFCPELPKGASYAVIYRATELAYYFGSGKGLLYPLSVEQYGIYKETANYTTGDTLPTSWTDNAGAPIDYEESKTEGYTAVTFPAEGETTKYVEKENASKAYKLVEFTSEQGQVTKYTYGTGTQTELLTAVTEPSGAAIKIAYNNAKQVESVESIPAGQKTGPVTTYTYYAAGSAPLPCLARQRATTAVETNGSGKPSVTYCSNVLDEVEPGKIGHSGPVEPSSVCTLWSTEPETSECKAQPPLVGVGQPPASEKAVGENTKASGDFRYLAQFPTSQATPPSGVRIISATYTQEVSAATNTKAPFSLGLYGITAGWSGSAAWPESATWTHALPSTPWAPGGDVSGTGASTVAEAGSKTGNLTWNVTEIVQEWSDGSAITPGRGDYGFALLNNEAAPQKENVLSLGGGYLEYEYEVYEVPPTAPTYVDALYEEASGESAVTWAAATTPTYPDGYPGPGIDYYQYRYALNGGEWSKVADTAATEFHVPGTHSGEPIDVEVRPFTYNSVSGGVASANLTAQPATLTEENTGKELPGEETEPSEIVEEPYEEEGDPKGPEEHPCSTTEPCGTFNYGAAVAYAKRWALVGASEDQLRGLHDPSFGFFYGDDCTNFASAALHAGGMQYMRSHGDDSPAGEGYESEFVHGEGAWWSYWSIATLEGGLGEIREYENSRTFSIAGELEKHLVEFKLGRVIRANEPVLPGDLIFFDQTGTALEPSRIDHTQIVIEANHTYVKIAQHSPSLQQTLSHVISEVSKKHGPLHVDWNFEIVELKHTKANIPLGSA
jgi:hypothetical protein